MERLTKKNGSGSYYYPKCFEKCNGLGASGECDNCEIMTSVCEKLGKYEDLEEQGRLINLPCMVGSDIYAITFDYEKEQYEITKSKIIEINQNCNGWFFRSLISIPAFKINDFGKSVFLARDEAEAKLKELRGGENDNS